MKKFFKILSIILVCLSFEGCFNYSDINKTIFATSIILDIDTAGYPVIYVEGFRPVKAGETETGKGERLIFKGSGKTFFETIRQLNMISGSKINYTHNKAIIYTRKAAERGIGNFVDLLNRNHEFTMRQYAFVYMGDPERLINIKMKEEDYIGVYIMELMSNVKYSSKALSGNLNDYLNRRLMKQKTDVLPVLKFAESQLQDKLIIDGGAVMKSDKMVSYFSKDKSEEYNFLNNNIKYGTLEVENPQDDKKYITLEINKSNTKTKLNYSKGKIILTKNIKVRSSVSSVQGSISFDKDKIEKIEKEAEDNITRECNELFNQYKKDGIDIFDVQEGLYERYPHVKSKNAINDTTLNINVKVNITGTGITANFEE